MSRELSVRGIVIGKRAAGEGSVRVYLYTDALGLVMAVAKSAREEHSKLRAHLQVGTFGRYTLIKGRNVWRVTGAWGTSNVFFSLIQEHRAPIARVLITVRQFVRGEGSDPFLFSVLWSFVHAAPRMSDDDVRTAESATVLRLLAALGYVRDTALLTPFMSDSYDAATLKSAHEKRALIVRTINEGMSASQL